MKYEYKIKLECTDCGSKVTLTDGMQSVQSTKSQLIQQYKDYECIDCGKKMRIDEIEKIEIEKDKIKNQVKM